MLKPISALQARHKLGELLSQVANHRQRFLIKRGGIPAAVLLSLADYAELEESLEISLEQSDRHFQASLRQARSDMEAGHFATLEDLEADLAADEKAGTKGDGTSRS